MGGAASVELEVMAEAGALGPLQDSPDALDISNSAVLPFLAPGESVAQLEGTRGRYRYLTIAAMLIPINDALFAVNGIAEPRGNETKTVAALAYLAISERVFHEAGYCNRNVSGLPAAC